MPGKHVRFAQNNTYHPIPPRGQPTPGFTAPVIPQSPYKMKPIISGTNRIRLHALLAHSPHNFYPTIDYDLLSRPSNVFINHPAFNVYTLLEPATNPPLPFMTIISPYLKWPFIIHATNSRFVSISDVLSVLYHTLRVNITSSEFHSLRSQKDQRRVTAAYEDRYRHIRDPRGREEEKRKGIKRVDFLMGQTRFMGLTWEAPGIWVLKTS